MPTVRDAALGDIHRNKFISPTVRIMKPQKQSLNIYKVMQCPTEMRRTKDEGTEGSPSPKSNGNATELCSTSTCKGERRGA